MISNNMKNNLNDQFIKEMESEYLYMSFGSYFKLNSLNGFASYFFKQANEEREHAMMFHDYIISNNMNIDFNSIKSIVLNNISPMDILNKTLQHEIMITKSINKLMSIAKLENDYATEAFLMPLVLEQIEEEDQINTFIDKLKIIINDGCGLLNLDNQILKNEI